MDDDTERKIDDIDDRTKDIMSALKGLIVLVVLSTIAIILTLKGCA